MEHEPINHWFGGEEHDTVDVLLNLQGQADLEFTLTTKNIKAIILVSIFIASHTHTHEFAKFDAAKKFKVLPL